MAAETSVSQVSCNGVQCMGHGACVQHWFAGNSRLLFSEALSGVF